MKQYPVIDVNGHLPLNDVWNVPDAPINEVSGTLKTQETQGPWYIPVSYRALAMDMHGRVFGVRTMSRPRESGHALEGRVKVDGKSYCAFTSSRLFARPDGSLCDVAILYVYGTPDMQWSDPAGNMPLCAHLARIYHYEKNGTYADLCRYATVCVHIASGYAATVPWVGYEAEAAALREKLAPIMNWS